jgi:hypothetical protein
MNKRIFASGVILAGLLTVTIGAGFSWSMTGGISPKAIQIDQLANEFRSPPEATKPRCYWYWMNGSMSKEGITKDLEAMRQVGIGEAYIGIIQGFAGEVPGVETKALTEEWWSFIEHAVREGGRIGVNIGLFNSAGWSQSGGPWVRPEQSMRYLTFPETRLNGPMRFEGKLPAPAVNFQNVAVLAFPASEVDGELATVTGRTSTTVQFEMPAPFTARSVTVRPATLLNIAAELQASEDGVQYRTVKNFTIDRRSRALGYGPGRLAPVVASFPATSARFFRLNFPAGSEVGDVQLSSAAQVESYAEKSLLKMYQGGVLPPFDFYTWPMPVASDIPVLQAEAVRDITQYLESDGTLRWDVPPGEWIVLRTAMIPTGKTNVPAPEEATGPEVDKMSRQALSAHFEAFVGELLRRVPAAERTALKRVVADSWEAGPQNWTDGMAADFKSRYGYDPLPWLPVMTGRVVGSADQSDRFLWDLRRMVADRVALDYVGGLRDLCHQQGLKMWLENYGTWGFPGEFLLYAGGSDEVAGEFWAGVGGGKLGPAVQSHLGPIDVRDAASAAHIYGKPAVWSEAFTGGWSFLNTPRDLKALGDWSFCEGINQFVLHVYIHQPWDDRKPGINAKWGTEFNRHNTWFRYATPWVDYMRRCSVMLQAGHPVADVAYFIGEDVPKVSGSHKPDLPKGYDYDDINADVLLNRAQVKDGRLVLPEGTSYGVLVLPPSQTMRPEVLKQIARFIDQGLPVLGSLPVRSPSLQGFPVCDAEIIKTAAELEGRILQGDDLQAALKVSPDVICPAGILWKHRQDARTDIYFVSNQNSQERTEMVSFRVTGRTPQLWRPDTGVIESVPFTVENGRTVVSLGFDPSGSLFVVFGGLADNLVAESFQKLTPVMEVTGSWSVQFDPALGGPDTPVTFEQLEDWTQRSEEGIKYYSGAAVYSKTFEMPNQQSAIFLDLGLVEALAEVTVNGYIFPVLWKPPYRTDITTALKPGVNELTVKVVNTWNNRLVGDEQSGVSAKVTFTTCERKSPNLLLLQPAGLLGPVTLQEGVR